MKRKDFFEKVTDVAEKLNFSVTSSIDDDNKCKWLYFQIFSPEGQDCNIEISYTDEQSFIDELYSNVSSYDPDEETILWYGVNNGEPKSLRTLLNDMEWFKKVQVKLYNRISKIRH